MKALRVVFAAANECVLEEFDLPDQLESNNVLIKTVTTLVSIGTEMSIYDGTHSAIPDPENRWAKYPFFPGYCAAGTVEAVGSEVRSANVGDRVFVTGNHASHHVFPEDELVLVPDKLSFEEAAFAKLGAISMNGVRTGQIALGESTVIFGQGLIGLLALQVAKIAGARPLIAVDLSDDRLDLSRKFGADIAVNPGKQDLAASICAATDGNMARKIIDASGSSRVIPQAVKLLETGGTLVLLGGPHGEVEMDFYTDVQARSLTIVGAHEARIPFTPSYRYPWSISENMKTVLNLIDAGSMSVKELITHQVSYENAAELFAGVAKNRAEHLGMIIQWTNTGR